jgi:hypothetical protein
MVYPKGHKVLIMLAAITCGMAIAACGSSKSSSTAAAAGQFAQGVKYADCMRSHGVTGFPDPSAGGGFALPSTINPQSPSYQVAHKACGKLEPGPVGGPPKALEQQELLSVEFSKCMRRHGLPDFPDPVISSRPPNQDQGFWRAGMYWPLPAGTQQSPAFLKAAKVCGSF